MNLPASLKKPDLSRLENNTIPSDIDPSKVSYLRELLIFSTTFVSNIRNAVKWWENGVAHSFQSRLIPDTGAVGNQGWTSVETLLIRLNTLFTPFGRFPVHSDAPVANGLPKAMMGYDAAVCVERYEPWIIEAYNTSVGFPTWSIQRVVGKGYGNTPLPSGQIQGDSIPNGTRYLNTTGKDPAFQMLHENCIVEMVRGNGLGGGRYVPSLMVGHIIPHFSNPDSLAGRLLH
jgi:hypothetical protein